MLAVTDCTLCYACEVPTVTEDVCPHEYCGTDLAGTVWVARSSVIIED